MNPAQAKVTSTSPRMKAHEPFSSATRSASRSRQERFSSNSLTTSLAARWLSSALVSRRRTAISDSTASTAASLRTMSLMKCSRASSSSTVSVFASALAERGFSSNSASSPKCSPSVTSLRSTRSAPPSGGRKISTLPASIRNMALPVSPLEKTSSPARKRRSTSRCESEMRASSERPLKSGTRSSSSWRCIDP